MFQRRLFLVLLRPSFFSTILTLVIGAVVFGTISWVYISRSSTFYDYFFGPDGLTMPTDSSSSQAQLALDSMAQSWLYNTLSVVSALLVGVLIYVALQALARVLFKVSETIDEVQGTDTAVKWQVKKEIITRLILRMLIGLLWVTFIYFTLRIGFPYCITLFGLGVDMLPSFLGLLYALTAFVGFFVLMHVHVIFMRLLILRPRVFGGDYVITSALEGY